MTMSCIGAPSRRRAWAAALGAAAAALAVAGALALSPTTPATAVACPAGGPLKGVQRPRQLIVLDPASPCRTAVGVVRADHREHDGDCHVNVLLDRPYRALLNSTNTTKAHGLLITEVIPSHRRPSPRIGSRVRIFGTWVLDKATGWRELHPVWTIQVLRAGSGGTGTC
jgi:hypothetical protein